MTFNADNNDEGNDYTDPWEFVVTITAADLSGGHDIKFQLLQGANDATVNVSISANGTTAFPVKKYFSCILGSETA